jgi:hypothetical protein
MKKVKVISTIILSVLTIMLVIGMSYAQENDQPVIPEKVMKLLEKYAGVWTVEGTMGDQPFKGRAVVRWAPGKHCLIWSETRKVGGKPHAFTALHCWDSVSEDGVISYVAYSFGATDIIRWKVESDTVRTAQVTGVMTGAKSTGKMRIEEKSPRQFTLAYTDRTLQGVEQGDVKLVYTKGKSASNTKRDRPARNRK